MQRHEILQLLQSVAAGGRTPEEAIVDLSDGYAIRVSDFAKIDGHRVLRNGFQETILCEGKRTEHVVRIVRELVQKKKAVLGTRASEATAEALRAVDPQLDYDPISRTVRLGPATCESLPGKLSIVCAGTADVAVAEEARRTAAFFGMEARRHYDVGVAGIHRLFESLEELRGSDAIIVIAGMEGALPSVVGGLVSAPIIAVPTSVGYGAGAGGIAALLGMLSSCSEGIAVVNIDNGFGAACAALRIMQQLKRCLSGI